MRRRASRAAATRRRGFRAAVPRRDAVATTRRRDFFAAAALAVLARPPLAVAEDRDGDVVKRLIAREEAASYAYRGLRFGGTPDLAAHEADHAKALRTELQALGRGTAPISTRDLDPAARRLADASSTRARRAAAIVLETDPATEYCAALVGLPEPSVPRTAAAGLGAHAQHRALLAARYPQ